jgi:adenosine deaminase
LYRGVPVSTIVTGLQTAIDERASHPTAPVAASLILCLVRELGEAAAAATLALTLPYLPSIEALGLASTEIGYPPAMYKKVFKAAGLLGLHKVAHAGG